jgi:hypothetical protein
MWEKQISQQKTKSINDTLHTVIFEGNTLQTITTNQLVVKLETRILVLFQIFLKCFQPSALKE